MEQKEVQNVGTVEETKTTENVDTQTTEQNEVKTFTQEEVNAMIQDRITREKKNMPSKDELKAFNEWKESQKTEAEKRSETLKENETLKARIIELENQSVVANAGVDSKFQKFVLSEVSQMEGDFEDNLKDYIKENPQYLLVKETVETPKTTGVAVQKINENAESGVSAILKAKHPNLFK